MAVSAPPQKHITEHDCHRGHEGLLATAREVHQLLTAGITCRYCGQSIHFISMFETDVLFCRDDSMHAHEYFVTLRFSEPYAGQLKFPKQ